MLQRADANIFTWRYKCIFFAPFEGLKCKPCIVPNIAEQSESVSDLLVVCCVLWTESPCGGSRGGGGADAGSRRGSRKVRDVLHAQSGDYSSTATTLFFFSPFKNEEIRYHEKCHARVIRALSRHFYGAGIGEKRNGKWEICVFSAVNCLERC